MIKTVCGGISDELFESYLDGLVGRFFKILALKDENSETLHIYIESFRNELLGSQRLILLLKNDSRFMSLISTLQFFLDNNFDKKNL